MGLASLPRPCLLLPSPRLALGKVLNHPTRPVQSSLIMHVLTATPASQPANPSRPSLVTMQCRALCVALSCPSRSVPSLPFLYFYLLLSLPCKPYLLYISYLILFPALPCPALPCPSITSTLSYALISLSCTALSWHSIVDTLY